MKSKVLIFVDSAGGLNIAVNSQIYAGYWKGCSSKASRKVMVVYSFSLRCIVTCSKFHQASNMERFAKIIRPLTIFAKILHLWCLTGF